MPPEPQPLVLCADDFALSPGVSMGILRLAERGRLSAISCMTLMPHWPTLARRLDSVEGRCDIGLHLTLTDQRPLAPVPSLTRDDHLPNLGRLLRGAFARRLDPSDVRGEIHRQWEAFVSARGRPPDFVDGHQHVHLLPGVRDALCDVLRACAKDERPYIRVCWEPPARVIARGECVGKTLLLASLSMPLRRAVRRLGLAANDSFRGVHAFDPRADYAASFRRFLRGRARRPLVMCHPGFVDAELRSVDTVTDQRRVEYDYLASERFTADLAALGWRLDRFRDIH
jgi:predicted glycoside hydrolase/deacetylase ChbG (UPF0249 family)